MLAILQVADTGPLESIVVMLEAVGWQVALPDRKLRDALRALNCDTVLEISDLVKSWGYEKPFLLPDAGLEAMSRSDVVFVDVKAHRNASKVWARWPKLKVLWYRINGGKPEHVITKGGFDCGDEVNPPCPVLTPNQWYKGLPIDGMPHPGYTDKAYACWPPFHRFDEYFPKHGRPEEEHRAKAWYEPPICLIHRADGWGYGALIPNMRQLGVRVCGMGSPDGLISHRHVPELLSRALCTVHLKSNDAPGYALYESLAAGCPVVCTRRLIWRCTMQELFEPGVTCLVFDRETHAGLTPQDVVECTQEVAKHLTRLSDPVENRRIGEAGRKRLQQLMWKDPDGLKAWLQKWYT